MAELFTCNQCGEKKPASMFRVTRSGRRILGCAACRAYYSGKMREYYQRYPEVTAHKHKEYVREWRWQVISHYGTQCACCGEQTREFLVLDHVNGGGNAHRRTCGGKTGSNQAVYSWIRRHNYPSGFQVLCHNCNAAKAYYGVCPHQRDASPAISLVGACA